MQQQAQGQFDVTLSPQPGQTDAKDSGLGRMTIAKRYHGELSATGDGEMLTAMTPTPGSAGYVAMERVNGSLQGRAGSFILQHSGTMCRGQDQSLNITVVPDSGTDGLAGIAGRLQIRIEGGQHFYSFDYSLPQ